jgi:glucose/arabinose dehydrogenase
MRPRCKAAFALKILIFSASYAFVGLAEQTNAPLPVHPTKVEVAAFAEGLAHPWGLAFLPDGRLLVTERPGRMRLVSKDGKLSTPIANVPPVVAQGQGGLLDVALAPDYDTSGHIYFSFSEPRA